MPLKAWQAALVVLAVLVALSFGFGRNGFRQLLGYAPVPDAVGVVTFHPTGGLAYNKGETVTFTLPHGWGVLYNGHQPFRNATILDPAGAPQIELTADLDPVETYPQATDPLVGFEQMARAKATEAGRPFRIVRRPGSNSPWLQYATDRADDHAPFIMARAKAYSGTQRTVGAARRWNDGVLIIRCRIDAAEDGRLAPVIGRMLSGMALSGG